MFFALSSLLLKKCKLSTFNCHHFKITVLGVSNLKFCSKNLFSERLFHSSSKLFQEECKYKVAIIGSGPAGFYTSQQLLKYPDLSIDIYERFPVPFGLVRFGVAPDHQEVKNVINSFTKVATNERTRFIGNIGIGTDVKFQELRDAYHAVVLCYGSSQDALLNIPGEKELKNVISARRFVGWYNGIPQDKDLDLSLCKGNTAVIIGQGNVALDCARILLTPLETLKKTDITRHACKELSGSTINRVVIVGRRGPLQAAFKIKEFRELTKIHDLHVKFDWSNDIRKRLDFTEDVIESLSRSRKRLAQLYKTIIDESHLEKNCKKECVFRFFLSPTEITGKGNPATVESIRLKENVLDDYVKEDSKIINNASAVDNEQKIDCGIIIRSIGYKATPIDPSLPFDHNRGIILNKEGRVINNIGLYCSGWAAFGASGVIISTMTASFEVGKNILHDIQQGLLDTEIKKQGYAQIKPLLEQRNANIVDFIDWQRIDQYEKDLGKKEGKPREKIVSVDEILDVKKGKE